MNTKKMAVIICAVLVGMSGYFCWTLNDNLLSALISFLLSIFIINLIISDIKDFIDKNKPGD